MYQQGLILIITGDGKGKTTSAIGQAIRALGHGMRVAMIQFLKGSHDYGEYKYFNNYDESKMFFRQTGRPIFVDRNKPEQIDIDMALQGWELAKSYLNGDFSLVIMDELNVAMDFGFIDVNQVIKAIQSKPANVTVVITGRGAPSALMEIADTVSLVTEKKHHYYAGITAQAGMEY